MQLCRDRTQQMAPTIQQQDDLHIQRPMNNMIHAFVQIMNYRAWSKGGSNGKGFDSTSLELKAIAMCGDPIFLAHPMKSYPRT